MFAAHQIHVIDSDSRRRARLAFALNRHGHNAHVYESIHELARFEVIDGLILLNGDDVSLATGDLDVRLARGATPIALYSEAPNPAAIVRAMSAGALDYLCWPIDDERIIAELLARAEQFEKVMKRRAVAHAAVELLSQREREVLVGMIEGLANKVIAIQLGISPRTVEIHRSNILRKLEVETSTGAVRIGIYAGLDEMECNVTSASA